MNNLAFTISGDGFQFKTLMCKQYVNRFEWNNEETRGRIFCSSVLPQYSYSTLEFQAFDSLALNYHPKDADGFIFIINRLASSSYVQLMTEKNLLVDYSPRELEVYIIPANRLFSFTYAPQTIGSNVQFFVSKEALKKAVSPALIKMLDKRPFFPLSELLNETLYQELCEQGDIFFNYSENMNPGVMMSLISVLKNFNDFAEKTTGTNQLYPYHNMIKTERPYEMYRQIA